MTTVELVKQEAGALEAQEVASKIEEALADGRKALWRLAEALYEFDEMRGWRDLGFDTLSDWLAETEGITRGTYYRLVGTWRKVVVSLQVEPERVRLLDQSKVALVADKIRGESVSKVDDVLADVEQLPVQDLRAKYRDTKPKRERPAVASIAAAVTTAPKPKPATAVQSADEQAEPEGLVDTISLAPKTREQVDNAIAEAELTLDTEPGAVAPVQTANVLRLACQALKLIAALDSAALAAEEVRAA